MNSNNVEFFKSLSNLIGWACSVWLCPVRARAPTCGGEKFAAAGLGLGSEHAQGISAA
jgi:hypothetical protein